MERQCHPVVEHMFCTYRISQSVSITWTFFDNVDTSARWTVSLTWYDYQNEFLLL